MTEESFEHITIIVRGLVYALFSALGVFTTAAGIRLFNAGRIDLSIPPVLLSVLTAVALFYVNKLK